MSPSYYFLFEFQIGHLLEGFVLSRYGDDWAQIYTLTHTHTFASIILVHFISIFAKSDHMVSIQHKSDYTKSVPT